MSTDRVKRAIVAWRKAIGARYVETRPDALDAASTTTFHTTQKVCAILRPRNREEVQACMRIASQFRVAVHPISKGKNYGYGSRVPYRKIAAVLDLGRMNRIVAFDERLAYMAVQPGVTFEQVDRFLRAKKSKLYMSVPGAGGLGSALANALERGIGRGPLIDRFSNSCGMEVVLANGDCVHTGFARFRGSRTTHVHRAGVGPSLDGLFSQSDFGVVTQLTLWLAPMPTHVDQLRIELEAKSSLAKMVDALQGLYLKGIMHGQTILMNDYRLLSIMARYPWSLTSGRVPLRRPALESALGKDMPPRWLLEHLIEYQSASERTHRRRVIRDALRNKGTYMRFDGEVRLQEGGESLREIVAPLASAFRFAYWRKKGAPSQRFDLDHDRVGVIFTCPVVPAIGVEVERAMNIIERTAFAGGFEPVATVAIADPRAVRIIAPLFYDREIEGEDARARKCSDAILTKLIAAGYLPYRMGLQSDVTLPVELEADTKMLRSIRRTLDPMGLLSRDVS